ncbi:XRE family transcriptional regulator [Pseudomonas sp. SWI6]|nr:XRE family transcriptional regulator [Pseudomonas sp. SWI6]
MGVSIRRLPLEVTGLDQQTFAAMCRISTKSLYELESGKSNPRLSTLEAMLRLFDVRMGMVMTAKDKPTATVVGNNVGQSKAGGPIAVAASLASTHVVAGPKRGKSPAAAKAKKAVARPASPRARKSSQEK